MMTGGQVTRLLAEKGIIPVVVSPNPHDKTNSILAAFGPLLDKQQQPVAPGVCYKESYLYSQFRMKKSIDHHDVWLPNVWGANCVILRLAEKNGTPLGPGDIIEGLSPLGEVQRIHSKDHNRRGFEFYGSGGNPVITGLVLPNANSRVGGDGATFESGQTILNHLNQTMELICERASPIVVVLAGDVLPKQYYDPELSSQIGTRESQAMYMGVYRVTRGAQEDPLSCDQVLRRVDRYKPYYPDLDETQMRFLLETTKKYILLPLDLYCERPGGYHHLNVDTRDTRKPLCEVPNSSSYKKVLSLANPYSEQMLFKEWVSNNGYLELLQSPFLSGKEEDTGSLFNPLQSSTSEQSQVHRMALFTKRKQSFEDHWNILLNSAVAVFARQLLLHVDAEYKIGPLIDRDEAVHTGLSALPRYSPYFDGVTKSNVPYLSYLGPEVQKSPTTHPIRTYDPKVMLLMESNNGGAARMSRPGLSFIEGNMEEASELFFHCFLVDILKVQVLLEWSSLNRKGGSDHQLPTLSDIPRFLEFIDSIILQSGNYSTSVITHDQYELNPSFLDKRSFHQFFKHLGQSLQSWLKSIVRWRRSKTAPVTDAFSEVNKRLVTFITSSESGIENNAKQAFHSQHILMNFNELIDEFPFGVPKSPVVGFGGSFGAQLLQEHTFSASNQAMVQMVMTDLLSKYALQKESSLQVLGLENVDGSSVKIAINGRALTTCESEHGCCMQYVVVERRVGGSKGLSHEPKLCFTYCHPIPNSNFRDEIATRSLHIFRQMVDDGCWAKNTSQGITQLPVEGNKLLLEAEGEEADDVHERSRRKRLCVSGLHSKRQPASDTLFVEEPAEPIDEATGANKNWATLIIEEPAEPIDATDLNQNLLTSGSNSNFQYGCCESKCDLMLGMVFGSLYGTVAEIGLMKDYTTQLRRDTARCISTELCVNREIYTLDNRPGEDYRQERHIVMSMCKLQSGHPLMVKLIGRVSQICLDHFWFMDRYWVDKAINKSFMTNSLPILWRLLETEGVIYFGLSVGIFTQVIMYEDSVMKRFRISLVHADNVCEIDLVKGSHQISDEQYRGANTFGKKDQKPEAKFGFSEADIRQSAAGGADIPHLIKRYQSLIEGGDPLSFRFIKLTRI
jgi:hypothetical protein